MIKCDYATGMFSHAAETRQAQGAETHWAEMMLAHWAEMDLAAIHEAGHAVAMYALGFGSRGISLEIRHVKKDGEPGRAYAGIAYPKKDRGRRLARRVERGVLDEQVFAYGVTVAAGPAAEWKLRQSQGLPLNMRGSTLGDRRAIETVAEALATSGAYDQFAYQEEVWQRAQALMENETVWGAVDQLAGWLGDLWAEIDAPEDKEGIFSETMSGPQVRAIIRRAGVRATLGKVP
jgi:hypothetical protein